MEVKSSWLDRLSPRDRRALIILAVVLLTIFWWLFVTQPLLDQRVARRRGVEILRKDWQDLQETLGQVHRLRAEMQLRQRKSDPGVLLEVERRLRSLSSGTFPALQAKEMMVGPQRVPAASLKFAGVNASQVREILSLADDGFLSVGELDLTVDAGGKTLSGGVTLWKWAEKTPR
jgi:hypothetical protein